MLRVTLVLALALFSAHLHADTPRKATVAKHGMVVCVSPPAADVGVAVLKKGGTAVDAAVAVAFAQAVTWPEAGNIGGGGFMLVWPGQNNAPTMFDYRETAPAAARVDMFAKKIDYYSPTVSGVPGTVRGMELAHRRFGKLPWRDVVWPAVVLAENGFPVDAALAQGLNAILADADTKNAEFRRVFSKADSHLWKSGDTLRQPDLGKTLRAVAEQGADAFYRGDPATKLVAEMADGRGLITASDLAAYRAKERPPVHGTYRGYDVYAASPPASGGITLTLMLNMLETFELKKHPRHSRETTHLLAEVMRRAYLERARYLGDPDFTPIPERLISKEYAKSLASGIDPTRSTPSVSLATADIPIDRGGETTHFSIVDENGMAVSNTYTIESSWGNRVVVRGAGYILNNEMTDFNHRPGVTDRTGRVGTRPNLVAPGKRMLSSQCPTILAKDGKVILVTGSPGGRTIINTVLCVVVNVVDYGMDVQSAVDAPRMHHQWLPDRIQHEDFAGYAELAKMLKAMGHDVVKSRQGDAHSIAIDPTTGERVGAADRRRDGKAAGY